MSIMLRSLLRDPLVARPLSRAVRRFNDDFFDEWPVRKVRRTYPDYYESPAAIMDDISRQMVNTMNRMQEMVADIDTLDEIAHRLDGRGRGEAVVRRTESGDLQLALDVTDFKPEDLKIKLVDDNLVIEAESEKSGKDSYRRNHFKRWFKVPEDCKLEEIKSKLTEDNRLLIDLPLTNQIPNNERTIPIETSKSKPVEAGDPATKDNKKQTNDK